VVPAVVLASEPIPEALVRQGKAILPETELITLMAAVAVVLAQQEAHKMAAME